MVNFYFAHDYIFVLFLRAALRFRPLWRRKANSTQPLFSWLWFEKNKFLTCLKPNNFRRFYPFLEWLIPFESTRYTFVFLPEKCDNVQLSIQQNILSFLLKSPWLLRHNFQKHKANIKNFFWPYLENYLKYPTKWAGRTKTQKCLPKDKSDVLDRTGSRFQLLLYIILRSF